jgi:hypothetical protein
MPFLKNTLLKQKKEDGMKKLVIVAIAVLLALPVLSYAGSATSKWDVTIGGYIDYDIGYANQAVGADYGNAFRNDKFFQSANGFTSNTVFTNGKTGVAFKATGSGNTTGDGYSNMYMQSGESRINFTMHGPDTFGAKTTAFLEWEFRSQGAGATTSGNGEADLRQAWLAFDWAKDQLLFGDSWQGWLGGAPPLLGLAGYNLPAVGKPTRVPEIKWTRNWTKNFKTLFGIEFAGRQWGGSPNNNNANNIPAGTATFTTNGSYYVDNYTRSMWPNTFLTFEYNSEVCGKIGPMGLKFGLGSVYGRSKFSNSYIAGDANEGNVLQGSLHTVNEDGWASIFYTYVPIIPEKNGNKAGALGFTGGIAKGQNLPDEGPWFPGGSFRPRQGGLANYHDFRAPVGTGWYAGLFIYFTDQLFLAPVYSSTWLTLSDRYRDANPNTVVRADLYDLSLVYAPNPAVEFILEGTSLQTQYARALFTTVNNIPVKAYSGHGTLNALRIHAKYYF